MTKRQSAGGVLIALAAALGLASPRPALSQTPAPANPAASVAKAKELVTLLQTKKLEAIAARDPAESGRFVAALHIPSVQLLVVSASYSKPSDLDARLYYKDFMGAYVDLNTSIHSSDKTFIEDALCDGLVALPGKILAHDSFKLGSEERVFDGEFADPRRRNQKKISQEDYLKAFQAAEERYARILGILIEEAKKAQAGLAAPGGLR